jgi:hypothetical protein
MMEWDSIPLLNRADFFLIGIVFKRCQNCWSKKNLDSNNNNKKKKTQFGQVLCVAIAILFNFGTARVAQWLERRCNDVMVFACPCVPGSNPTVGRGCWSFGWDRIYKPRTRVAVDVGTKKNPHCWKPWMLSIGLNLQPCHRQWWQPPDSCDKQTNHTDGDFLCTQTLAFTRA